MQKIIMGAALCFLQSCSVRGPDTPPPINEADQLQQKLQYIRREANTGPFKAHWDSLANYQIPAWYQDAKFGIFIHWGVYSVPAFNGEWYPRFMYNASPDKDYYQYHLEHYGELTDFGYKDFIPQFTGEFFNAAQWASLFKESGARYVIPVAEHHDGFAMYDSALTEWNAMKMGPKRDVIAELEKAIRAQDLYFGLSSHRAENWWFFSEGRSSPSDVQDERYRGLYGAAVDKESSESGLTPPDQHFLDDWLLRTVEIVDKYHPDIVWFDWWIAQPAFHQNLQTFSAYYYNQGVLRDDMVAINYKKFGGESFPDSAGVLDIERGQLAEIRELFWQTDTSVSKNSWGYVQNHQYKQAANLVDDLIDIVSKNGTMLLNIGPKADGTIPEQEQAILRDIGAWLAINGEAIYATRPWQIFGEGETQTVDGTMMNDAESLRTEFTAADIRFTQKPEAIYAILMAWPGDGAELTIKNINTATVKSISAVSMLGSQALLQWQLSEQGLVVQLPASAPHDFAQVLKIQP